MLALGTLGAGAAVWTGLRAGEGVMIAPSVRDHILVFHRALMLIVFALSLALCLWALSARPMPRRGRSAFVVLLFVMTALLAIGADFGGWMVYSYNAGGSLPQPIEFSP
jgi:heme A synthase